MAKSVNKVILVGNVGQDPEVKYTASGVPVAKVSLATNERFKDRNDQWQDRTEWHSVVAWQRLAEIVGEYVREGSKLYVEGKLQTSTWEDRQNGEKKYRTELRRLRGVSHRCLSEMPHLNSVVQDRRS